VETLPKRIFDLGDTGPIDRPEGVKQRHHELADIELDADVSPYIRNPLTKLARRLFLQRVGHEGLAALIDPKDLGRFWENISGAYLSASGVPELIKRKLEEQGHYLHSYPHYRTEPPSIVYKTLATLKPPTKKRLIDIAATKLRKKGRDSIEPPSTIASILDSPEGALSAHSKERRDRFRKKYAKPGPRQKYLRDIRRLAKEKVEDFQSIYENPESRLKRSRDIISHEYGHELEYNPASPFFGKKAEGLSGLLGEKWDTHDLIYYLQGLRSGELKGTYYEVPDRAPTVKYRQKKALEKLSSDPQYTDELRYIMDRGVPEILEYLKGRDVDTPPYERKGSGP
jgi:hypothetical protein